MNITSLTLTVRRLTGDRVEARCGESCTLVRGHGIDRKLFTTYFISPSRQTYLYHHYVLGALFLNFGVLDFHSHDPPIMQHRLVDLSQGGCTLRLLLKEDEQLGELREGEIGRPAIRQGAKVHKHSLTVKLLLDVTESINGYVDLIILC